MKIALSYWKKSLMARLVSYFLILSIISISLVSYMVYRRATESLKQAVFDRLEAVATLKENGLNRWINYQRQNLEFISALPEVQDQAGQYLDHSLPGRTRSNAYINLNKIMQLTITNVPDISELYILDPNGIVVISTDKIHEGKSEAESPYFIQGSSITFTQPITFSPKSGKPIMYISTPLFNPNKERVGVFAGEINLDRIILIMHERTGLGSSGETYLIGAGNGLVSNTLYSQGGPNPEAKIHSKGIDNALAKTNGSDLYTNYQGIPVIGVYHWMADPGVGLVAEISVEEAYSTARQLAWTISWIGLLTTVFISIGIYWLARQIARPILAITKTAAHVANGDLTQTAPVMTEDEVGDLALAFNQMTGQLRILYQDMEGKVIERTHTLKETNLHLQSEIEERQRIEETLRKQNAYLSALHDTAIGLISRLDINDLLLALVNRAGQLLDTPNGFIYLQVPDTDEMTCEVGSGGFAQFKGGRIKIGEGLAGKVMQSGVPLAVDNYDDWTGRSQKINFNQIKAIVGLPLKSGEQIIGVIGLAYDPESHRIFGEKEIELLNRFAQLADLALDNARLFEDSQAARNIAEEASRAKSAFLANVSHELRTPLTAILGFTRIIQKRFLERITPILPTDDVKIQQTTQQINHDLQIILSEGQRLTQLINDILDLEKIEVGKMEWRIENVDIGMTIDKAISSTMALFEEKGLKLVKDIQDQLPIITVDPDKLYQVMINLLSNAVKFTDEGSITCRARFIEGEIIVSVIDTGRGIIPSDQIKIFEKFYQSNEILSNKPEGTGLGLAICKEIVEHYGGHIWVVSELGQGSTFTFSLPTSTHYSLEVTI